MLNTALTDTCWTETAHGLNLGDDLTEIVGRNSALWAGISPNRLRPHLVCENAVTSLNSPAYMEQQGNVVSCQFPANRNNLQEDRGKANPQNTLQIPTASATCTLRSTLSSLFKSLPRNAGSFSPKTFDTVVIDGVNILPVEVIQEGVNHWSKYLVGFLDSSAPYQEVVNNASEFGS